MKGTDRFRDLAELRSERERLRALRDKHQAALHAYWELVHEKEFRRGLAGDAFGDMLKAWRPLRTIGSFLRSDNGAVGSALGLVMGARSRTLKGRLITWAIGAIAPMLMRRYATPERLDHLAEELQESWDRVKERMRQRRTERQQD